MLLSIKGNTQKASLGGLTTLLGPVFAQSEFLIGFDCIRCRHFQSAKSVQRDGGTDEGEKILNDGRQRISFSLWANSVLGCASNSSLYSTLESLNILENYNWCGARQGDEQVVGTDLS